MPVIAAPPRYEVNPAPASQLLTQQDRQMELVAAAEAVLPLQPAKMALYRMVVEQVCSMTAAQPAVICTNLTDEHDRRTLKTGQLSRSPTSRMHMARSCHVQSPARAFVTDRASRSLGTFIARQSNVCSQDDICVCW